MKDQKQGETGIKTVYHTRDGKTKINRALNANRAVEKCVAHMQIDHYNAHLAEVYDAETGELHAQIKWRRDGTMQLFLKRNPRDYETKYAISHLIGV
jgi:hypothetical protein